VSRSDPGIAVAIATRDRPEALLRCLQSLFAGELLPGEVVVVDQSSGPPHAEPRTAPVPVTYVARPARGLAAAQNEAVALATAPLVAVTDDDCVVDAGWLLALATAFREDPSLDLVAGRVLPLDDGDDPELHPVALRVGTDVREFARMPAPWLVGSGNNFAVRRDRFLAAGGCDDRLGPGAPARGGMDMDLFYRLLRAGGRARYDPAAIVYHERKSRAGRRRRRFDYGYGMGASCGLLLRRGDAYALRMLAAWIGLRLGMLARDVRRANRSAVLEELVVLGATARGLLFPLSRAGRRAQ